jgi:AcrR family transcriptional regulator
VAELGLRERKKWATRRRISDVATGLFLSRGFDNVTVAEVAEAAGVAKMTVFNYFPRKEDLFLDRIAEVAKDVTLARALHRTWLAERHPMSGIVIDSVRFWRVVEETPSLSTRLLEQREEFQNTIADALRVEGADPVEAELAAGFVATAHGTVFGTALRRMLAGEDADDVQRDQVAVIETAFDALERGLAGFAWAGPR